MIGILTDKIDRTIYLSRRKLSTGICMQGTPPLAVGLITFVPAVLVCRKTTAGEDDWRERETYFSSSVAGFRLEASLALLIRSFSARVAALSASNLACIFALIAFISSGAGPGITSSLLFS